MVQEEVIKERENIQKTEVHQIAAFLLIQLSSPDCKFGLHAKVIPFLNWHEYSRYVLENKFKAQFLNKQAINKLKSI